LQLLLLVEVLAQEGLIAFRCGPQLSTTDVALDRFPDVGSEALIARLDPVDPLENLGF
jgi:hypothetical protein